MKLRLKTCLIHNLLVALFLLGVALFGTADQGHTGRWVGKDAPTCSLDSQGVATCDVPDIR